MRAWLNHANAKRLSGVGEPSSGREASSQSRRQSRQLRRAVQRSLRTIRNAMKPTTADKYTQTSFDDDFTYDDIAHCINHVYCEDIFPIVIKPDPDFVPNEHD